MKYLLFIFLIIIEMNTYAQAFELSDPKDIALVPIQNNFRNLLDLSGIWKFKMDSADIGEKEQWFNGLKDARAVSVPGSWNAQFDDMRDYLDLVWYETETYIPSGWNGQKIFLRVNDATYAAKIWINGQPVGYHEGCHVPFAFDISSIINWGELNKIVIQVENRLSPGRVPTGNVKGGSFSSFPATNYDFFPYSGLNRSVLLYSVPENYIKDITIKPGFDGSKGKLDVLVENTGKESHGKIIVSGEDKDIIVPFLFQNNKARVQIEIPDVRLWSHENPYLYTVSVSLGKKIIDSYTLKTGVRTVNVDENNILLNGKPIFLKGFGRHEDFPVLGRSSSNSLIVKDFELMKWSGANSFRTTHYPYAEENYNLADKEGFYVIGETPGVGLYFTGDSIELEQRQKAMERYIEEMYLRDKNHPSIIMWCVANEPNDNVQIGQGTPPNRSEKERIYKEFEKHFTHFKELDDTRLVMYVGVMMGPIDWFKLTDVIAINRYWGWYTTGGDIESGARTLSIELDRLHRKFKKPCMLTEFGADAMAGFHAVNSEMFSEEYQKEFIKAYLDVADEKEFVAGMQVWNLADFKTGQWMLRFGGYNMKGVFTRDRKPKMAAHYLRERWYKNK